MKNFERIAEEIRRLAREHAPASGRPAKELELLALQIVNETDRRRTERRGGRRSQHIKPMIRDAALDGTRR